MRQFLVTVQVILVVAGLGLGGYAGYRAYTLLGKDDTGQLQSYLIFAVLALVLVVAAGAVRPPRAGGDEQAAPAPQRRAAAQQLPQQYQQQPYRPGGPSTGQQPPIGPGGPHTGSQPPVGAPDMFGEQPYGDRTERYPRT
ncbi:MAG TPA: hypothetical protein VGP26_17760 [Actinophytocola sp.]|jgi:hypothetical protein|nr:hypothetical protein [Actinophytocola sp.]